MLIILTSISKNSLYSCTLEVDLEYPGELHNLHNDYPLAPEKLEITYDTWSDCGQIQHKS